MHCTKSYTDPINPTARGRAAGPIEILGDADPGEGGYGNLYVTIGQALLTPRTCLEEKGTHLNRVAPARRDELVWLDSNQRPRDYEARFMKK